MSRLSQMLVCLVVTIGIGLLLCECSNQGNLPVSKVDKPAETVTKAKTGDIESIPQKTPEDDRVQDSSEVSPSSDKVLLIIVDTLRADTLGCYGYGRPTTPTMDRLAAEGILFEQFHAASPWTAPAFGTILTGVSPSVHKAGVRVPKKKKVRGVGITKLSEDFATLPEMLGDITTGAITTNSFLHPGLGYGRGFDFYDHKNGDPIKIRRADEVTKAAISWLKKHKDSPFFFMIHFIDPHTAYDPPKKYADMFTDGPKGRIKIPFVQAGQVRKGLLKPTPKEKQLIRSLYDAEVRFVDQQIGKLISRMNRMGILDSTWVVITSDHGEEHFEHGQFEHGHRYEEEVTRVPLIIRPPGGKWNAGSRIQVSTSHVDLVPTIASLFSVKPPGHLEGRDLMPIITGKDTKHGLAYMEYNLYGEQKTALYDGKYKLIMSTNNSNAVMYDLVEDKAEKKKLTETHPAFAALKKKHHAYRTKVKRAAQATDKEVESVIIPARVEKSLRALGYITDNK